MTTFAEAMCRAMDELDVTKIELAVEIGVTRPTVKAWMDGRVFPHKRHENHVCAYLGIEDDDFDRSHP